MKARGRRPRAFIVFECLKPGWNIRTRFWNYYLSNSLIIHTALTQPAHLILARWIGSETQWKTGWKHGRVLKPVFETISNTDANFLNLHIDKATKIRGDKQLYLITHFTKQSLNLNYLLPTLNVMGRFLNNPKHKRPFFFLINILAQWWRPRVLVHFQPCFTLPT